MNLNYILWNLKPQLIDFGRFEIRYYSLLFAITFIVGYLILQRIFKKEGYSIEFLDKLTLYMVLGTIIGARLGHCLFYEFDYYIHHPLEIILPWRGSLGKDFEFTGFQGLASHGAAIGVPLVMLLLARKTKTSWWWIMDKIVMVTALGGFFIRTGNLMNSEIYGKPTGTNYGFVYARDFTHLAAYGDRDKAIKSIHYRKALPDSVSVPNAVPLDMEITLSNKIKNETFASDLTRKAVSFALYKKDYQDNIVHPDIDQLKSTCSKKDRYISCTYRIYGIPRHPTQLYEACIYLLIFFVLMGLYMKYGIKLPNGFILGVFFALVFLARFLIEFVKENQESFEDNLSLNMGQILSIPFILLGIILMIWRWPAKE